MLHTVYNTPTAAKIYGFANLNVRGNRGVKAKYIIAGTDKKHYSRMINPLEHSQFTDQ